MATDTDRVETNTLEQMNRLHAELALIRSQQEEIFASAPLYNRTLFEGAKQIHEKLAELREDLAVELASLREDKARLDVFTAYLRGEHPDVDLDEPIWEEIEGDYLSRNIKDVRSILDKLREATK